MRREKLYKNCVNKSILTDSDSFPKLNMNNLRGSALSPHDKNVWKKFLFAIGLFYTASVELSTAHLSKNKIKILSFSQVEIYGKQKSFPNIFIISTTMWVVHSKNGKNH